MPSRLLVRTALHLMGLVTAPGLVWAGPAPATVPWSLEAVVQHPRWIDFSQALVRSHLAAPSDDALRASCRARLERGGPPDSDPVSACIEGALHSLDDVSLYQAPKDYAEARRQAAPWVGIGLEIAGKSVGSPLRVAKPIPGGPAEKAGIRPDDGLVEVDGVNFLPLSVEDCVRVMRGPEGSTMRVVLRRGDSGEHIRLDIRRARIQAVTAYVTPLAGNIVQARIVQFRQDTAVSLNERLDAVRLPGGRQPAGLIVDLRDNPGGSIGSLVSVAAAFAPPGSPVVSVIGRDTTDVQRTPMEPSPTRGGTGTWLGEVAVVVLVNERTSGAAEAFAQFLRETRGATLMGRRTSGGALVRTLVEIGGDAAVQVLTATMVSPRGQDWRSGLAPDIALDAQQPKAQRPAIEDDPWLRSAEGWFSGARPATIDLGTPARATR